MDLALNLGMTYGALARSMTERELRQWAKYRRQKLLPLERMELYLAQLAQIIAITLGGAKNTQLTDYLIELREEEKPEIDIEALREAFGYKPRKKTCQQQAG